MVQLSAANARAQEGHAAKGLGYPTGGLVYVDSNNGNNGNNGETKLHAVKTLARAVALAQAGDTIILNPRGGETLTATIAVALAGLKIICPVTNPQSGYTLTGAGSVDLLTVSAADVHLEGLRFARTAAAGGATAGVLTTAAADRLTVVRCVFDSTPSTSSWTNFGVEVTDDCDDVLVLECLFLDLHRGVLFDTATGKTQLRATIKSCTFYVGQATAFGIYAEPAGTGLVQGLQILNNTFLDADGDGSSATDAWDGTDGTDAATGPIWLDADVDQSVLIAGNRAYTALTVPFTALNAVDAGALVDWVDNKAGEDGRIQTITGEMDVDIDQAVYTNFIVALTVAPAAGHPLKNLVIDLDFNKTSTGFDNVATAADVLDIAVILQVDGTNYRQAFNGTQITANGNGTLDASESGARFAVGDLAPGESCQVHVKINAERSDFEIPFRLTFVGAAPTVTAVAAV